LVTKAPSALNSDSNKERKLDPNKDADEILRLGKWHPYTNRIITNGVWKIYFCKYTKRLVWYTFEEASRIEVHQKFADEKRLGELIEMFKPLPLLDEEGKKRVSGLTGKESDAKLDKKKRETLG
jgi:hypothetical protein